MNRLKFADDLIATAYLDIKSISSNDIDFGFLPSFGPAFVNFYGSGRQFEVISSDHSKKLDEGIGEGGLQSLLLFYSILICRLNHKQATPSVAVRLSSLTRIRSPIRPKSECTAKSTRPMSYGLN